MQDNHTTPARILVVDDVEINRDMMSGILSAAGFAVDVACDGQAGYEATWGTAYDLVLMDVEMPGLNGFEAAAQIRAREGAMEGLTIAALTATREPGARDLSFWSGIDEFIERPIDPRALVSRVSRMIADRRGHVDDCKPVWRLGTFSAVTTDLSEDEADAVLDRLAALFSTVSRSIDTGASATEGFLRDIDDLLEISSRLGFEETSAVCRFYTENEGSKDSRCRDANLLGAIGRARYAIANRFQTDDPVDDTSLIARVISGIQGLFAKTAIVSMGYTPAEQTCVGCPTRRPRNSA